MRRLLPTLLLLSLATLATANGQPAASESASAPAAARIPDVAGLDLGSFTIGKTTYREVRARSRDARSLVFTHSGGLGSVRLRDLPPELQSRLGYDPATAPADTPPPPAVVRPATTPASVDRASPTTSRLEALFSAYAEAPELRPRQTLQPEFIRLGLYAKNQGRRPSCSIFAVVSALEFQNALLTGGVETLSEEYLVWATRRSLGLTGPATPLLTDPQTGEVAEDTGFTLPSVIGALQTYGIPLYEDMRNQPGVSAGKIADPAPETISRARARRLVFITQLPGGTPARMLPRLVHALNAGYPVPAGLAWPGDRAIRAGFLSTQSPQPGAFHAVTFVGYECPTGALEDTIFIFKNSYGPRWGQGGYGRATTAYLTKNLLEAYVLDVREPGARP